MHLTLKLETEIRASLAAQQREFDLWRREFNEERPHEALGQKPPATVYRRSSRRSPRKLLVPNPDPCVDVARVDKRGFITWHRRTLFISSALAHELIELAVDALTDTCQLRFGAIPLGRLDLNRLDRGLILPRRPRRQCGPTDEVSAMSLG